MDDSCHVEPVNKTVTAAEQASAHEVLLWGSGMGCPNCAMRVRNSLIQIPGALEANVDHRFGTAQVVYNPELVSVRQLIEAVARAGGDGRHHYEARLAG